MRHFIYLILGLFSSNIVFGQRVSSKLINFNETQNQITTNFKLCEYSVLDTSSYELYGTNTIYNYISVNDERFGKTWDVGFPCLPQLTINYAVPNGASNFELIYSDLVTDTLYLSHQLLPSQEDLYDSLPFSMDVNYYQSDGSAYSDTAVLSEEYYYMSQEGISLTIFPFIYNPTLNRLVVIKSGTYTLNYNLPSTINEANISEAKGVVLKDFYQNYNNQNETKSSPTLLIITDPMYVNALTYYVNYKRNLGFAVTLATTTGNTGTSRSDIKDYIEWKDPDFVLLVGDENQIPTYGTLDGSDDWDPATDFEYTRLDGNDFLPDVFLGRFSVTNISELQIICNKNIFMEMNHNQFDEKVKLVAAEGQNNWWTDHFEEGHNYVVNNFFNPLGYISEKLYEGDGATTTDIFNSLSENPIFFLYSGHGNYNSSFTFSSSSINDYNYSNSSFPLAFSFACYTGNFGKSECFGEKWIRSISGGVSYFGCSVHSLVEPDIKLEKSIFMGYSELLGQMINMGKVFFWYSYHTNTNGKRWKRYMRSYNLLGDPTFVYTGINCVNEFIFSNNEIFHDDDEVYYRAANRIITDVNNSSFIVQNGATVKLYAGNEIILNPGFVAENGSDFTGVIEPCNTKMYVKKTSQETNSNEDKEVMTNNNNSPINDEVNIFPNPFKNNIFIDYTLNNEGRILIELFDVMGNNVQDFQIVGEQGRNVFTIDGSNLISGIYLLKILTPEYKKVSIILKN